MTSIVITPFDPEHTEELKEFLWKVIDRADFAECMPPSVQLVDVQALEAQRDRLLSDLLRIADTLRDHPDADKSMTRVGFALTKARTAINETKGTA